MKNISIREIESAIDYAAAPGVEFDAAAVMDKLDCRDDEALRERVERTLEANESLFGRDGKYRSRAACFNKKVFVITPDEREIDDRILFFGHRFAPFCRADIFPSEITLTAKGFRKAVGMRELKTELTEIFRCHMLLGSEQVSDYLVAEHPDNAPIAKAVKSGSRVTLNVLDMADFYSKHSFAAGDALLCEIVDYENGRFKFSFLSGEDRRESTVKEHVSRLGEAITEVIGLYGAYLDLPEALARAFFIGGDRLFGKDGASLDEFIFFNEKVDISFDNGYTTFVRRHEESSEAAEGGTDSLPEGISLSGGDIDSLSGLLKDIGSDVSVEEIDGAILDACYSRELFFDDFFRRLFDRERLKFTDAAQEAVFYNFIEERWEELTANYDRAGDEAKAGLRSSVLELIAERRSRLAEISSLAGGLDKAPEKPLRKLAEMAIYANDLLRLLNSENTSPDEAEQEKLSDALEGIEDIQNEAIEAISQALNL